MAYPPPPNIPQRPSSTPQCLQLYYLALAHDLRAILAPGPVVNLQGRTAKAQTQPLVPRAIQRSRKISAYYPMSRLRCSCCTRFTKACRQKGRWINVAISFGVDIQDIIKFGIRSDIHNLDADDEGNDDEYRNVYAVPAFSIHTLTHPSFIDLP